MFWGLELKPGKSYSQMPPAPMRLTQVVLSAGAKQGRNVVMVKNGTVRYALCSLALGKDEHVRLDLFFAQNVPITFMTHGDSSVYISGYYTPPTMESESEDPSEEDKKFGEFDEMDETEADEETARNTKANAAVTKAAGVKATEGKPAGDAKALRDLINAGNKKPAAAAAVPPPKATSTKALVAGESDSEGDEGEGDYMPSGEEEGDFDLPSGDSEGEFDMDMGEFEGESEGEMGSMDDDDEEDMPKIGSKRPAETQGGPAAKKAKDAQGKPAATTPVAKPGTPAAKTPAAKTPAAKTPAAGAPKTPTAGAGAAPKTPGGGSETRRLQSGLELKDVTVGAGKAATRGKRVRVAYRGTLTHGSEFDKSKNFIFRLGVGEVIQGWDQGVEGMKVGGKRQLTVPAKLGYGGKAMGSIPANSTLKFDVELLEVLG